MENVTLTQKEQARLQVLNSLLAEHMTPDQAATLMGVTTRHTRRILAAYREKGVAAVAHGHRGRRPPNTTPEPVTTAVVHLARTRYSGANHTHLSELLSEREGIDIGRTTLRRILVNAGLSSPRRRRPPKHRVRRQRMPREGMLIQLDGSYHRWLGEDGPQFTILLAVDDATGCVVNALFCDHEDTGSYFLLMQGLLRRFGIPLALYTDRHAVFKHRSEYQPAGTPTQFGRAMEELGIQMIFALSPQAKGRVERTAGTFQDRLITELRLAGAPGSRCCSPKQKWATGRSSHGTSRTISDRWSPTHNGTYGAVGSGNTGRIGWREHQPHSTQPKRAQCLNGCLTSTTCFQRQLISRPIHPTGHRTTPHQFIS